LLKICKEVKFREWGLMPVILIVAIVQVWLDLMIPGFMRQITVLTQAHIPLIDDILRLGVLMLLSALGSLICVFVISFLSSRISASLSKRLRYRLFSKVGDFSITEFSEFSTSSLIARSTNDITQFQQFTVLALSMMLRIPILTVGAFAGIAGMGMAWTVSAVIAFVFVLAVVFCAMAAVMPQFKKMQSLVDKLNLSVREILNGRFIIRAFNAEKFHEKRFEAANEGFTNADRATNRAMAIMSPIMSLGTNGVIIAVYIIGAIMVGASDQAEALIVFSNLIVMTFYLSLLFTTVKFVTKVVPRIPRASVSAARIAEVLDAELSINDGEQEHLEQNLRGELSFRNVGFKYPGSRAYALEGISFSARQGETVAIIGSTGSGKTTLVNLIMRFLDATDGEIIVDGINIKDYKLEFLYKKLGYVPQKSVLMSGTIGSNIALGDSDGFSLERVAAAANIARASSIAQEMESGYEAAVTQRGTNFSGGQKQRISIARALYKNPEILVLDDSFSALDVKTDNELRAALRSQHSKMTKLIVAQRIDTIRDADQILVLDEGKMAGIGTHDRLLETCSVYREIFKSQAIREESVS